MPKIKSTAPDAKDAVSPSAEKPVGASPKNDDVEKASKKQEDHPSTEKPAEILQETKDTPNTANGEAKSISNAPTVTAEAEPAKETPKKRAREDDDADNEKSGSAKKVDTKSVES